MRYLLAVITDRSGEILASREEMTAIDAFNEAIDAAGQRVMAAGIATPDRTTLVDNRDGRGSVSAGPAVDSDLFMAGFWVIEAEDDTVALRLAHEASRACNRRIEIRPILH